MIRTFGTTTTITGRQEAGNNQMTMNINTVPLPDMGRELDHGFRLTYFLRHLRTSLVTRRVWLLGVAHVILFALAYWSAFLLETNFRMDAKSAATFWHFLPALLILKLTVFGVTGQLHGWWRYVTFGDLIVLGRTCLICLICLAALGRFGFGGTVPRLVLILDSAICLVVIGSLRSTWRLFRECVWPAVNSSGYRSAILIGTDDEAVFLAHQIQSYGRVPYRVRGVLRTEGTDFTGRLGRIPILGHVRDVASVAAAYGVTDVLVTAGRLHGRELRNLMDVCKYEGLQLKIVPRFEDRLHGDKFLPVRNVAIEDLLRRDSAELDTAAICHLVEGRTVMITGAGGSIGSEICRILAQFSPSSMVLLGRGENRIFAINNELKQLVGPDTELHVAIADVRDKPRVTRLFEEHRPHVVFHAAAHKHVPLMEANVGESVKNNVVGTKVVADAASEFGAASFVLVSTDKAVRPTSIMGATKQIAERYIHALSNESATCFVAVRFGNVLGSTGSVVPVFQEQFRCGGPITITDPNMERFFMTIPEASRLVLQAAAMGKGGEVFLLEMGHPVKIVDLARDLIRLSGLPEEAIEIVYTGMRPGEKMNEELSLAEEQTLETSHPKLRAVYQAPYDLNDLNQNIEELRVLCDGPDPLTRRKIRQVVRFFDEPAAELPAQTFDHIAESPALRT